MLIIVDNIFYISWLGEGLGKNSTGITAPIKASLKFDNAGLGEEPIKTDHWWERVFNEASSNLKIETSTDNKISVCSNWTFK